MNLSAMAREAFGVKALEYPSVRADINACWAAYQGRPYWLSKEDNVASVGMATTICQESARLTMIGTSVHIDGSSRAEYLQKIIDKNYNSIRMWVEWAHAYGTVIVKPNGDDFDVYLPGEFIITETNNNDIAAAVFVTRKNVGDDYFTRLEWHRFENGQYCISNRCFIGDSKEDVEREIPIELTPWKGIDEEATIDELEHPLFATIKTPNANNIDIDCPITLPLFSSSMQELHDLDIAYSRFTKEIDDSKRTVLIDADRLMVGGGERTDRSSRIGSLDLARSRMGLPDMIRAVEGNGNNDIYNEINPSLNTSTRLEGINHLLSEIGYKVGFSNGYFVFNEQSGIQTATGVEASQQRTIQFIKDCRDNVESAIKLLIEALSKVADVYDLAPVGEYELTLDFGDLTYNRDEDRLRYLSYVSMGKFPFWRYLVKFEGYTEEEAKQIEQEAQPAQMGITDLFANAAGGANA